MQIKKVQFCDVERKRLNYILALEDMQHNIQPYRQHW
jgi:hypothetical protein